jgi:hypothetical protein
MSIRRESVSAVVVFEDRLPETSSIKALADQLASRFMDSEIVLVANGVDDAAAVALKAMTEQVPDLSVLFLASRLDGDEATLAGIENAVGDWVLLVEAGASTIGALPQLFDRLDQGFDVVIGRSPDGARSAGPRRLAISMYFSLYRMLNGVDITMDRVPAKLLSRAAALHLLRSPDGEALLRAQHIPGGFPTTTIDMPAEAAGPGRPFFRSLGKAVRLLVSSGAAPLRFISMTALTAALIAVLYSGYVVAIYLFKADVAPGWTTISLQVALLMFLFSAMFAVLAEYVVQIHSSSAARRRHVVSRELRSPLTRRGARLNVVDSQGEYRLGAPPEIADRAR